MRVIYESGVFLDHRFGGILRYIHEIASGVHEQLATSMPGATAGTVSVLAGFHCSPLGRDDFPVGVFSGWRVPSVRGAARACRMVNDRLLAAALATRRAEPVVLHETLFGCTLSRLPGVRRVVTVHDLIWEEEPSLAPPLALAAKARSIAHADAVLFVSHATQRAFARHYSGPAVSAVIHHGCELRLSRNRRPVGLPWPFVLYVGQRGGYKNWDRFFKAFARSRLADTHGLVMFGVPPTRYERDFVRTIWQGSDRVRWVRGDDDLLADLYEAASCFVYPSRAEGFGMPLVEAARQGCPIACSDIPPFREVLGDGAVYFDPMSPAGIASAVEATAAAGRQSATVGRATAAAGAFRWATASAATADFYRSLVVSGKLGIPASLSEVCA